MFKTTLIRDNFDKYSNDVFQIYRETYSGPPYYTSEKDLKHFEEKD